MKVPKKTLNNWLKRADTIHKKAAALMDEINRTAGPESFLSEVVDDVECSANILSETLMIAIK